MPDQLETTIETESGLNRSNADMVREELSGGFTKANSLDELDRKTRNFADQNNTSETNSGSATPSDSIGLSDTEAGAASEDASEDVGEEEGVEKPSSKPTEEDENSPFSTYEEDDEETDEGEESLDEEESFLDYDELSNQIGYEINSQEDLIDVIRELKGKDPLEGLSPLMRQAAEFERNGGDIREYFDVLSVNTETLSPKEAMWQQFKTSNSSLSQESPEFARQKFEKEFDSKYRITSDNRTIDDFDSVEEFDKFVGDKKFAQQELEWESKKVKESLEANRQEALAQAPSREDVDSGEQERIYNEYQKEASYFKENFDSLQIPIDEGGKTLFNIGLNEKSKPLFDEWMGNPSTFLQHIGIGSDNNIDVQSLTQNMALIAAFSVDGEQSVGYQFAKAMTERINKETIETKLENPAPEGGRGTSGSTGGSDLQEAISALREGVMKERRR